jgi:hypothetical protein
LFLLLGKQKKKERTIERTLRPSPKNQSFHYIIAIRHPNSMLPLAASPNLNYVAGARIHHRREAANGDDPFTPHLLVKK